jgi:hypothetical protein
MTGAPYVIDVAFVVASLVVLRRRPSGNALVVGLLFMLLCLRPTFDLVCETVGFAGGFRGDLWHLELVIGSVALWSFLLVSLALCLLSVVVILRRYDGSELGLHGPNGKAEATASRRHPWGHDGAPV